MSFYTHLSCTALLVGLMAPQTALADITADDVWQNYRDYVSVFGSDFTTTPVRDGGTLTVHDLAMQFELPMNAGKITVTSTGFSLTEQADGTVLMTYPNPIFYSLAADLGEQGGFSGKLAISHEGLLSTASGTPGDITYAFAADHMTMTLRDVQSDKFDDFEITASGELADFSTNTRITVATHVTVDSTVGGGAISYVSQFKDRTGVVMDATGGADSMSQATVIKLPRSGMDIMNMAAAFRDGLTGTGTSHLTGYFTSQTTTQSGKEIQAQTTRTRDQTTQFKVDQAGLQMSGAAHESEMTFRSPNDIPFPVEFQMQAVSGAMTLPWASSLELQDMAISLSLDGLTMAEDLWALFDSDQALPRDPATIVLDMSAEIKNFVNWLDFRAVQALENSKDTPVELHGVTLNTLTVDMAGARLTGNGAASFDNSDLETYGGFPKPTGALDLALQGGNGLLDTLVSAGLIAEADATGARMMLGMVAAPDPQAGEDAMKSRLEITEQGHILANGQRLR